MASVAQRLSTFARKGKRIVLTAKRGNKNFYKGYGAPARKMGRWTATGFKLDPEKVEQYTFEAPDLTDFELKPYVKTQ
eukprot:jgi/Bigna1/146471/aug1.115_g21179